MRTLTSSPCLLWHRVGPWGASLTDPYTQWTKSTSQRYFCVSGSSGSTVDKKYVSDLLLCEWKQYVPDLLLCLHVLPLLSLTQKYVWDVLFVHCAATASTHTKVGLGHTFYALFALMSLLWMTLWLMKFTYLFLFYLFWLSLAFSRIALPLMVI